MQKALFKKKHSLTWWRVNIRLIFTKFVGENYSFNEIRYPISKISDVLDFIILSNSSSNWCRSDYFIGTSCRSVNKKMSNNDIYIGVFLGSFLGIVIGIIVMFVLGWSSGVWNWIGFTIGAICGMGCSLPLESFLNRNRCAKCGSWNLSTRKLQDDIYKTERTYNDEGKISTETSYKVDTRLLLRLVHCSNCDCYYKWYEVGGSSDIKFITKEQFENAKLKYDKRGGVRVVDDK